MHLFRKILKRSNETPKLGVRLASTMLVSQSSEPQDLQEITQSGLSYVFFYPRAETPVCTAQACELRDVMGELERAGVQVIGVSPDSPERLAEFAKRHGFDYTLLSDPEGEAMAQFGVKRSFGLLTQRRSFLVEDGEIIWEAKSRVPGKQVKELFVLLADR